MGNSLRVGFVCLREGLIRQLLPDLLRIRRCDDHVIGIDDEDTQNVRILGIATERLLDAKEIVQHGGGAHH
jgi:hypothetical protein